VVGEWPAYRVSSTHVMTMQHRLYDCFWQMRMPQMELGSDASVALIAYLVKNAEGGDRRPRSQALSRGGGTYAEDSGFDRRRSARRHGQPSAQQKPAVDPAKADAASRRHFPRRRPTGSRASCRTRP
jgi:hypothetical protein